MFPLAICATFDFHNRWCKKDEYKVNSICNCMKQSLIILITGLIAALASAGDSAAWGQNNPQERTLSVNGIQSHYQTLVQAAEQ